MLGMGTFQLPARFYELPPLFGCAKSTGAKFRRLPAIRGSHSEKSDSGFQNRIFIFGLGFVGQFIARQLKKEGWVISGTCTSLAKKFELEKGGFEVHLFNANEPEWSLPSSMKDHTHLLVSIPPVRGIGDPLLQNEDLLKQELCGGNLQWLCYLSSTSVYGNCAGAWVDENYPASPTNELSQLRLAAEKQWLNLGWDLGASAYAFRLGGIYGPGRSAVDTIIKQQLLSESQKMRTSRQFTSRVHVEDICQALKAAIDNPPSGNIYNIVDDDPAPREEVFAYALDLIKGKGDKNLNQAMCAEESGLNQKKNSSRGEKRVCNAQMKKELGVKLLHPSYKSGLRSIIEQMN